MRNVAKVAIVISATFCIFAGTEAASAWSGTRTPSDAWLTSQPTFTMTPSSTTFLPECWGSYPGDPLQITFGLNFYNDGALIYSTNDPGTGGTEWIGLQVGTLTPSSTYGTYIYHGDFGLAPSFSNLDIPNGEYDQVGLYCRDNYHAVDHGEVEKWTDSFTIDDGPPQYKVTDSAQQENWQYVDWGGIGRMGLAEEWTPTTTTAICRTKMGIMQETSWSPSDDVQFRVLTGASAPVSELGFGRTTVHGSALPKEPTSTLTSIDWDTDGCMTLNESQTYWLVVVRTDWNGIDQYSALATTSTYPNMRGWTYGVNGWATSTYNWYVEWWGNTATEGFALRDAGYDKTYIGAKTWTQNATPKCPDWGWFTPACEATIWLVWPDFGALADHASSTKAELATKWPISYLASFVSAIQTGTAVTTSTSAFATSTVSVDISAIAVTTTSFGTFLPSRLELFSASTVTQYMPNGTLTFIKWLIGLGLVWGTVEMIYFGTLRLWEK